MPFEAPTPEIKVNLIKALTTGEYDQGSLRSLSRAHQTGLQAVARPEEISAEFRRLLSAPAFQIRPDPESDDPFKRTPEQEGLVAAYIKDAVNYALAILVDETGQLVPKIKEHYKGAINKFSAAMVLDILVSKIITEWIMPSPTDASIAYQLIAKEITTLNTRRGEAVKTVSQTYQRLKAFCERDSSATETPIDTGTYDNLVNNNLHTFYPELENTDSMLNQNTQTLSQFLERQTAIDLSDIRFDSPSSSPPGSPRRVLSGNSAALPAADLPVAAAQVAVASTKKTSPWIYGLRAFVGIVGAILLTGIILTAIVATHGGALAGAPWLAGIISPIVGYVSTNLAAAIGIGVAAGVVATTAITAAAKPSVFTRAGSAVKKGFNKIRELAFGSRAENAVITVESAIRPANVAANPDQRIVDTAPAIEESATQSIAAADTAQRTVGSSSASVLRVPPDSSARPAKGILKKSSTTAIAVTTSDTASAAAADEVTARPHSDSTTTIREATDEMHPRRREKKIALAKIKRIHEARTKAIQNAKEAEDRDDKLINHVTTTEKKKAVQINEQLNTIHQLPPLNRR